MSRHVFTEKEEAKIREIMDTKGYSYGDAAMIVLNSRG